jgi:hypothetical protein
MYYHRSLAGYYHTVLAINCHIDLAGYYRTVLAVYHHTCELLPYILVTTLLLLQHTVVTAIYDSNYHSALSTSNGLKFELTATTPVSEGTHAGATSSRLLAVVEGREEVGFVVLVEEWEVGTVAMMEEWKEVVLWSW